MLHGHADEAKSSAAPARVVFSVEVALHLGATAIGARVLDGLGRLLAREAQPDAARTRPLAIDARHFGSFAVLARMQRAPSAPCRRLLLGLGGGARGAVCISPFCPEGQSALLAPSELRPAVVEFGLPSTEPLDALAPSAPLTDV